MEFVTPYRQFVVWFQPEATHVRGQAQWATFVRATENGDTAPNTVTYRKNAETGFYEVHAYNRPADEEPDVEGRHAAE